MTEHDDLLTRARAAKKKALESLADLENVCGFGITRRDGKYAIKINLSSELPEKTKIPKTINGVAVVYKVVGKVKKQPSSFGSKLKLSESKAVQPKPPKAARKVKTIRAAVGPASKKSVTENRSATPKKAVEPKKK